MKTSQIRVGSVYRGKSGLRMVRHIKGDEVIWSPVGRPLNPGERNFCLTATFARWAIGENTR